MGQEFGTAIGESSARVLESSACQLLAKIKRTGLDRPYTLLTCPTSSISMKTLEADIGIYKPQAA